MVASSPPTAQVELDKNKGNATSKAQEFIYSRTGRFITTVLVGNNITNVIYGLLIAKVLKATYLK